MTKATNAVVIKALEANLGIVAPAARMLGITRQSLATRIKRNPVLQEAMANIEETALDSIEGKMFQLIDRDDGTTIRWYLERKGKSRGYSLQEITINIDARTVNQIVAGFAALDLDTLRRIRDEIAALPAEGQ